MYALVGHSAGTYDTQGYDILRYKPSGQLDWSRWVSTRSSSGVGLAVTAGGKVYVGGSFYGTVDFDPGAGARYYSSGPTTTATGFVLYLTSAGNFGWVSPFVAQNPTPDPYQGGVSYVNTLAVDGSGNVLAGGFYSRLVDFNPGSGTTTLPAIGGAFIVKLTGSGSLAWARALEKDNTYGTSNGGVRGLATDAAGNVYATGSFNGTIDFDPGAGTHTRRSVRNAADTGDSTDAFVLKLTAGGSFAWAKTFGGAGGDSGDGIAIDPSGLIHLAGYYGAGTVDFDPDPLDTYELTNPGTQYNRNSFLVRLRQS